MEQIKKMDDLTKVMNKELFKETVDVLMSDPGMDREAYAMFYVDIRGFKAINEIFGREEGNKV